MTSRSRYTAILDANVLVSIRLTDLFVQLAVDDVFRAKWTVDIHREWMAVLNRKRPDIDPTRLERRRDRMDAKTRDALVTGYENSIDSLSLRDKDDRHVLAAAIVGRCDVIVTYNLKDFPKEALEPYKIEAQHPDVFLANHLDLFPGKFCAAVRKIRRRHVNKKYSVEQYLDTLSEAELVATASRLREYAHLLD